MNFFLIVLSVILLIYSRPIFKILNIKLKFDMIKLKELEQLSGNLMAGEKDVH